MNISGRWQALTLDIKRFGVSEVALRSVLNLMKPWFILMRISSRELGKGVGEVPKIDSDARILSEEEMRTLPEHFPNQVDDDFVEAAIQRGDICLAALLDNKIIGMDWRSYNTAPHEDGLWVRFKPPYRYGYKAFVKPEFRGNRVLQPNKSDAHCRSQGRTHTIAFIERHNLASIQGNRRRNVHQRLGYVFIFRLFGRRFMYRTHGVVQAGFEFYEPDA